MRVGIAALFAGWAAASLAAHEGSHPAARQAASIWDVAVLTLLAAGGLLYGIGWRQMIRRGVRTRSVEVAAFWSGLATLAIALAPPLDAAAERMFSAHMVQHELLMLVGVPLLIVGRPIVPWLWALPAAFRARAAGGLQLAPVMAAWRWLTIPVVAWVLHGSAIWIWHLPALYETAVASERVHLAQHATFVGTAVLFWWGLVYGRYGRAAYGASALYVFTTMVHTGVLGAMFALSESPFYPIYRDRAAAAGVDAAVDQQLAGLYMWIPAGIILTVFGLALLVAWLSEAERRSQAKRRAVFVLLPLLAMGLVACRAMPPLR